MFKFFKSQRGPTKPSSIAKLAAGLPKPITKAKQHIHHMHDHHRLDNFAWLRAENWQESLEDPEKLPSEIVEHLRAENVYQEKVLSTIQDLKSNFYDEMRGRIKENDSTVPIEEGPYAYQTRYKDAGQYPTILRYAIDPETKDRVGDEEILIDGDEDAIGHDYYDLASLGHSPDHRFIDISRDYNGSEYYEIAIIDQNTGKLVDSVITHSAGSVEWTADSRGFFYIWKDETGRPKKVYFRSLEREPTKDNEEEFFKLSDPTLIYEEEDDGFFVNIHKIRSGAFIQIIAHDHTTSEIRLIDASMPLSKPILVAKRENGHEYSMSHAGDHWFILTNCDDAVDFKIMTAPRDNPCRDHWTSFIDHDAGTLLLALSGFQNYLVVHKRQNALPVIEIFDINSNNSHEIDMDEEAFDLTEGLVLEWSSDLMRFVYESPTTQPHIYSYHMGNKERLLLKVREVPSGHDPQKYKTERLWLPNSEDGQLIPVTITRLAKQKKGPHPVLLYGYGSYGITIPANFNANILSLVDRGINVATAHIRGSKAKGYQWYLDGKREKKRNSFVDFISVAEGLVDKKITKKGKIAIQGGSAGGLLMGAVLNMAPEGLLAGAVAQVPFVDVLTTMCDADLPLTPPEWPEWGNPIEKKEDYETILAYSPYDQVISKKYPPVLITAGISDPRVTYWEPAKWAAKLRKYSTSNEPILLKTNMTAGHAGASGRFDSLKERALVYAFITTLLLE